MKFKVHFFKPGGKWGYDEMIEWKEDVVPHLAEDMFLYSLKTALRDRYKDMITVAIDPPCGFPIMMFWKGMETVVQHNVAVCAGQYYLEQTSREMTERHPKLK